MSVHPEYRKGYQDGYDFGHQVGMEAGIQRGFEELVFGLGGYISSNQWLWNQGDGFGGYVRDVLEDAWEFWGFRKRPRANTGNRAKRTPLRTSEVIAAMLASNGRCVACGSVDELQVDHILPVSRGGTNDSDNLQMLCQPCNASKRDKTMDEWQGGAR